MATTHTPATLAAELGTTAKTMRKFLRSDQGLDSKVGKGRRWEIDGRQARSLKARFPKWQAAQEAERQERQAKRDAEQVEEPDADKTVTVVLEDTEPTAEELAEIDDEN